MTSPHFFTKTTNRLLLGTAAWAVWMICQLPHPLAENWARGLLLAAPLIIMPLALEVMGSLRYFSEKQMREITFWQLQAAMLFAAAYLFPPGYLALGLALPWVGFIVFLSWLGLSGILKNGLGDVPGFCLSAGLAYLAVAAFWIVCDRLGLQPLRYDPEIVFLTIAHFHYAGFLLPVLAGLALRQFDFVWGNILGYSIVAGIALVAAGIVFSQLGMGPAWEAGSAWLLGISGMVLAVLYVRLAFQKQWAVSSRLLWLLAAACLFGGMVLAGLYGSRSFAAVAWLDIPMMRALHGTANSVGFCFLAILGWWSNIFRNWK